MNSGETMVASWLNTALWGITELIIVSTIILLFFSIAVAAHYRRKAVRLEAKTQKYENDLKIAHENDKFINDIIKHFNDYLFFHDMEGNFLEYNPVCYKDSDYTKSDLKQMNLRDIVHENYIREVDRYLERIKKRGSDSGYFNVVNRNGDTGILEYLCSVIYDENGGAVCVRGISRNITERVQDSKALKESEKKYRDILDSIEDGYYEVDLKGHYRFFNNALCRLLGYTTEELYDKSYKDIVHKDYQETVFKTFNYVYRTGKPVKTFDWKVIHKDGTSRFAETSVSLRRDQNGNPNGFQGIFRDVTPRINALEKRNDLENQLHQAQKMESIGTLAGGIAHDFNNILFPIIGYTELVMKGIPICSKTHENLEKILSSANRAKGLVKQILNFSRYSVEKDTAPVLVQPVLKETLKLLRTTVGTNIEVRSNISKNAGKVSISYSRIHQVIMNLCTNAYQAMEEHSSGRMIVSLKVIDSIDENSPAYNKITPARAYLLLSVSDTGIGIDPDIADKIFDPYFTTKPGEKGTGLGLSVSHGIIKNAGGTILVDSVPGKGSRFDVYLPVADESAGEIEEQNFYAKPDPTGDERILLADDEKQVVDLQKQILESLGYHVTAVTSSTEALEIFKTQPDKFDLVVTDQTMPDVLGTELAEQLRKIRPDIKIILCTGFNDKTSRERFMESSINFMLKKPTTKSDLAWALREVLDGES